MKINTILSFPTQDYLAKPKASFSEYVEQKKKTDAEIKVALEQIEQQMVDLKLLINQIATIKCKKDVS